MYFKVLLLLVMICPPLVNAQVQKEFIVRKGEVATKVIPVEEQYLFPQFRQGQVVFFNNKIMPAAMNYSLLYGEVHFLNEEGDTLSLESGHKLRRLTIGKQVFYFAHLDGFLEEIADFKSVKLSRNQRINLTESKPPIDIGEYGEIRKNFKEIYTRKSEGEMVLEKQISYFFIDKNQRFYPARRTKILKIFPAKKKKIKKFIKANKTDFHREKDLIKLLEFCIQ